MPEKQDKKLKRMACEQMYCELDASIEDCAKMFGVTEPTIYKWIQKGKWREKKTETMALEKLIAVELRKALYQGLKSFAKDPTNKDLQSLVSLLKQFKEQNKPSMAYKDNVLKFLDMTTDFFLERGMEETADAFKKSVFDLADYLLNRQ